MKVIVNQNPIKKVVTVGVQGPSGPNLVTTANDVDATNLVNGSLLIYNTTKSKWEASTTLENQTLECGHY
jgi:hypothetical protein